MRVPTETHPLSGGLRIPADETALECPPVGTAQLKAADLVYDLRLGGDDSDGFYRELAQFSDRAMTEVKRRTGSAINDFISYVRVELRETGRSPEEYGLDLLVLGLALGRYLGAAEATPSWVVGLAHELYRLRRDTPWAKRWADFGRAAVNRYFLGPKVGRKADPGSYSHARISLLIEWLQATGEFEQEIKRLNNWRSFLDTLSADEASRWMEISVELIDWFEQESAEALGAYTSGVVQFLAGQYHRRGIREDQIFCGRGRVEYHLAMVATEIMNRGLEEQFQSKRKRVVLVPVCMRGKCAAACRAHVFGADITCVGCDPSCAINRITKRMRSLGADVYLVPHATGFSRWLKRWEGVPDTGVVAAACLLNILSGGYEMRARGIPSQCVPLDFPGCQKHWRRERIPTGLNEERLVRIVVAPAAVSGARPSIGP